jgi:hypothetical protein
MYQEMGVQAYYQEHGSEYRNPHWDGVLDACRWAMSRMVEWVDPGESCWPILDLACGSGEASMAVQIWLEQRRRKLGAEKGPCVHITACDPYTGDAYRNRMGMHAFPWSFLDIVGGVLGTVSEADLSTVHEENMLWRFCKSSEPHASLPCPSQTPMHHYVLCVCSFAAHLIPESMLFATMYELSLHCDYLLLISPHKRPLMDSRYGWELMDERVGEMRVHGRLFRSLHR